MPLTQEARCLPPLAYAHSEMLWSDFRIAKQQRKEGESLTLSNPEELK